MLSEQRGHAPPWNRTSCGPFAAKDKPEKATRLTSFTFSYNKFDVFSDINAIVIKAMFTGWDPTRCTSAKEPPSAQEALYLAR